MTTGETHRLAIHRSETTNDHLSASQTEIRPRSMSAGRAARSLMRDFPGWQCWYGRATRVWWGMPPSGYWYPWLIEAATPDELEARVRQICVAGRRVNDRPHS